MRIAVVVVLGVLAVVPARAGARSSDYDRCLDRAGGIATNMHDCEAREAGRLGQVLNGEYQTLIRTSPPPLAAAWGKAQRAWLPYRKAECDLTAAPEQNGLGIGMWVDIAYGCEMEMTEARTKTFRGPEHVQRYRSPGVDACVAKAAAGCASDEAARLDKDLNAVYRGLMDAIGKRDEDSKWRDYFRAALKTSERAWLAWRDVECEAAAAGGGESARDSCRLSLLAARISRLRQIRAELDNPF